MLNFLSEVRLLFGKKTDKQQAVGTAKPVQKPKEKKPDVDKISSELNKKELELVKILEETNLREKELERKGVVIDERETYLRRKEQSLESRQKEITTRQEEIEKIKQKQLAMLEQIAGLSKEEAKKLVVDDTTKKLATWVAKKIEEGKESIKANEEEVSQEILAEAMRHGVTDFVAEYTVSTITLPSEEVKGKIIGREGRNIRAFEKATGVELELDEGNELRVSSFDAVRREIAKLSLQKLIRDGRIQPVRIEEIVRQTREQIDKILLDEGKRICQSVGVFHLPIDLVKMIGKYKYRFSYGQNLAVHTIEETKIGIAIASELKADVRVVRLGCLLHDIGKVISDEEGSHVEIGAEYLRKYNLPIEVINCVAEHHEDKQFSSIESTIVWIADAASGSRPGARYQAHEEYLKRMTTIEEVARSFEGVEDVAAYQAGREIRVIVRPEAVSDDELTVLVQKIAEKLDEDARWAGQIKITAIRETRAMATAPLRNHN